jgi:hypothetical protein
MNSPVQMRNEAVAVRHRATSAQPPRTTSPFQLWSSPRHAPHPFPSTAVLDTPGALLEGLRCFPAACPLPVTPQGFGKIPMRFPERPGDSQ